MFTEEEWAVLGLSEFSYWPSSCYFLVLQIFSVQQLWRGSHILGINHISSFFLLPANVFNHLTFFMFVFVFLAIIEQHKLFSCTGTNNKNKILFFCCPLQVRLCTAGCCGTLSRTWMLLTNCSWRKFTSAPAETDTFPSLTRQGHCITRGHSMAASSLTNTSSIASYYWYKTWHFSLIYSDL